MPREPSVGLWEAICRVIFGYQEHKPLEIEDSIRPAVVLRSDRLEWGFVAGETHCWGQLFAAPIAGQRNWAALRNPVGSRVLAVVEDFSLDNPTNTEHVLNIRPPAITKNAAAATTTGNYRDSRWTGDLVVTRKPACILAVGALAVDPSVFSGVSFNPQFPGTRPRLFGRWAVIEPGADFEITNRGVGAGISASFVWRELPLFSGLRG